jgi:8-oxo-dGTP diphosphatase
MTQMPSLNQRQASRLIVTDGEGRVLLLRHVRKSGETFWAPPGGGLEEGETFEHAASREGREELGVAELRLTFLWEEMTDFAYVDGPVRQQERFFLAEGDLSNLLCGVQLAHQQEGILEAKWWTLNEVKSSVEPIFPLGLVGHLKERLGSRGVTE